MVTILIRPIPSIMMPNQVEFKAFASSSRYGDSFADPITIVNVRFVPKSQLKFASTNETLDFNSMLFIDLHTSKQLDVNGNKVNFTITPKEKDQIIFNGATYEIINANPLLVDADKVHHYECMMNKVG